MKMFLLGVVVLAVLNKVWAFSWTPNSVMHRSTKLRMVSAIDIKPPTAASVPEIQDDDSNRGRGNMRPRASELGWQSVRSQLSKEFGMSDEGKCSFSRVLWRDLRVVDAYTSRMYLLCFMMCFILALTSISSYSNVTHDVIENRY